MTQLFVFRSSMPASAETVYGWHVRPGALGRLQPPWEKAEVIEITGGIEQPGSRVTLRIAVGPFMHTWVSEHTACEPGRMFRDAMIRGPFRRWEHTHLFIPDGPAKSWLEDRVEYELPLGFLGKLVASSYVRRRLRRLFEYRHAITAQSLAKA